MPIPHSKLKDCLAYTILQEPEKWLGSASPTHLRNFLFGVELRAILTDERIPAWRVYGPLFKEEFYKPIVARTGNPGLAIVWDTALEFIYFSHDEGMKELSRLFHQWYETHDIDTTTLTGVLPDDRRHDLPYHLGRLAKRPGMYLLNSTGWSLFCLLQGMDKGGDWLGLTRIAELNRILEVISDRSKRAYGSSFAAYREYAPAELLEWAGINPID